MMHQEQLFTGSVLMAVLVYAGYQLRQFPAFIWAQLRKQLVYTVHVEETTELFDYFETWLEAHHNRLFKNVRASIGNKHKEEPLNRGVIGEEKKDNLLLSHYSDTFFLKYQGKRLMLTKGREKFENASDIRNAYYSSFRIEAWMGKNKINHLLNSVIEYNKSIRKVKQIIYTNNSWGEWNNFGEVKNKNINNVIIKQKQEIIDNISDFILKESWYLDRGLSYRRGYLFFGPPGNGKTSLCLALAKHFNKDIHFLNLNDLEKDASLFNVFNNTRPNSILVIEDIDSIFGSREEKSKISFSALLNCLDGAFSKHGIIVIMTTNHIQKIDPALIREGRIDMRIFIDNPDNVMITEYLRLFYNNPDLSIQRNPFTNISMSFVQEVCLRNKYDIESACKEIFEVNEVVKQKQTHAS